MQAYGGTDILSEKLQRTRRIDCEKPECTVNCAYTLSCYKDRYRGVFVGIWLAVGLILAIAALAIV